MFISHSAGPHPIRVFVEVMTSEEIKDHIRKLLALAGNNPNNHCGAPWRMADFGSAERPVFS